MSTARADLKSTISADTTQFAAGMRRAGMIARATGANIGKGMAQATRTLARLGATAIRTGAAMAAIGGAITIGTFSAGIKGAADLGGALSDVAAQTGIAAGRMAVLQKAFADNGLAAENAAPVISKMQKFIRDLSEGTPAAVKAFDTLGITLGELQSLSPDKQLELIGKRIMAIEDPALRAGVAMDIFGRSGAKLITLFGDGGAMANAEGFLGTAAEILNRRASDFDTISDKLASVPAKLQGFFVGFLDGVAEPIMSILTKFETIDFAAIGQRFAAGLNMENIKSALTETFVFASIALSEGLTKSFEIAYRYFAALFSKEGIAFLGVTVEDVMFAAFDAAGEFLSGILTMGIEKAKALWEGKPLFEESDKDLAETAADFAARLKKELSDIDVGPSEALKAAAAQYAETIKSLFPKVEGSGGSVGSTSEADEYDKELEEQRKRVAADAAAMAAAAPIEPALPIVDDAKRAGGDNVKKLPPVDDVLANPALAGGFTGLAGLAQMQIDRGKGVRSASGLSGGSLQTGGLGAKRAVGQQKADGENKKNLTLAEKQAASLENIERKIEASLTVN